MDEVIYVVDVLELASVVIGLIVFASIGLIWLGLAISDVVTEWLYKRRRNKFLKEK